jgi:carbon-monoxide dehydrogenase small subunit
VIIDTNEESRLIDILRSYFNLLEARAGCYIGTCGACSILLNGEMVKACLIPVFKIHGSEIITIEGFAQTDEYQDIVLGFSDAGVENCGLCNTAKVLAAEALLSKNPKPSNDEVLAGFHGIRCRCTIPHVLVRGIMAVSVHRQRRLYGHFR